MTYLQIVNLVSSIVFGILTVMALHFMVFAIVGLFKKKSYPHTDTKLKYGLIIPARNEAAVVGNLIKSIQKNKYPQDKLQIFLIAHNCTDNTAQIGRELGATVYEYNNPNECTMGYAFRYLFDRINEDYGTQNYDGFFLFNADNILAEDFFDKMNDAFVAGDKKNVITSFRNSKNFGSNVISACYGLYFASGCRYESRGRTALGCSTRVQGTGYVISSEIVKNGWPYVTLTEDWEFTADQILVDTPIQFCDDAMFYDEQPTSFKVMWRQRLRWAKGHLLVCLTRFKDLVKGFFKKKEKGGTRKKGSNYDIFVNILPVCVISTVAFILNTVLHLLAPVFDPSLEFVEVLLDFLKFTGIIFGISYVMSVFSAALIYIVERKKIKGVSLGMKILSCIIWPFFLFLSFPCEIVALFWKNLGWKPIPHTDTTDHETIKARAEENNDETVAA